MRGERDNEVEDIFLFIYFFLERVGRVGLTEGVILEQRTERGEK